MKKLQKCKSALPCAKKILCGAPHPTRCLQSHARQFNRPPDLNSKVSCLHRRRRPAGATKTLMPRTETFRPVTWTRMTHTTEPLAWLKRHLLLALDSLRPLFSLSSSTLRALDHAKHQGTSTFIAARYSALSLPGTDKWRLGAYLQPHRILFSQTKDFIEGRCTVVQGYRHGSGGCSYRMGGEQFKGLEGFRNASLHAEPYKWKIRSSFVPCQFPSIRLIA